jgi:hypothetical protein
MPSSHRPKSRQKTPVRKAAKPRPASRPRPRSSPKPSARKSPPKKAPPKSAVRPKAAPRPPARAKPAPAPKSAPVEKVPEAELEVPLPGGRRHVLSLAFVRDGDEFLARLETDSGHITELKNRSLDQLLTLVAGELEDLLE